MAATTADALPVIDLRLFTQSDLRALAKSSSSSSSAYDFASRFGPDGDVPVPKIDRAVFNESAGSRKQTYSRLRLAPRNAAGTEVSGRERVVEKVDEIDDWENRRIVAMLKELVGEDSGDGEVFEGLVAVEVECDPELDVEDVEMVRQEVKVEIGSVSPLRRKRGRPRKDDSNFYVNKIVLHNDTDNEFNGERKISNERKGKGIMRDEDDMEMMNKDGVMVDVVALGNVDDPFGPEIRRRTEGMTTKEQLLEFLNGLEGQWVSRRRKRKIVGASAFGDFLPEGWKLVFSIKKKAGLAWLICRQYISPSGREFISCKEVSSYLQHLSGMQSEEHKVTDGHDKTIMSTDETPNENMGIQIDTIGNVTTIISADETPNKNIGIQINAVGNETAIISAEEIPTENMGIQIIAIENDKSIMPAEEIPNVGDQVIQDDVISHQHPSAVQISDLTNQVQSKSEIPLSEKVKNDCSPHILHSSPKTKPKRRKLRTLVSDGVIITDGKFECQFCHKMFDERRRYNGHVGVHVRSVEAQRGSGIKPAGNDLSSVVGVHPVVSGLDVTVTSSSGAQANHNDVRVNDFMDMDVLHTNFVGGSDVRELTENSNIEKPTVDAEVCQNVSDKAAVGNYDQKSEKGFKMADDRTGKVDNSFGFGTELKEYVVPHIDFVKNGLHELCEGSQISMSDVKTVGEDVISEKPTVVYNAAGTLANSDKRSNGDSASNGEKLNAEKTDPCGNNIGGLVSNGDEEHTIDFTEQFDNEKSPFMLGMVGNQREDVGSFCQQRNTDRSPVESFLNEQRHMSTVSDSEPVASGIIEFKRGNSEENPSNLVSNKQMLILNNNFSDGIPGNSSTSAYMHSSNSEIQPAIISSSSHEALGINDWSRDTPQKIFGVTYLFPSLNQNIGAADVEVTSTGDISKSPWKSSTLNPQLGLDNVDRTPNVMANKEFWKAVSVPSNNVANSSSEIPLDMAAVSSIGHVNASGGYPFSSNGGEHGFNIRNGMAGMGNSSMQETRPERDYVTDFVNQFENGQNDRGNPNMFPTRPLEQSRDNVGYPLNSELKISLGNEQSRLESENRNLKGQSLVLSGNEHFGLQNNTNSFYNSSVEEARNQRTGGSSLMDQFGQQHLFGLQNNLNQAYNGSMWGGQRLGAVGNFVSNDVMTGFGSGQPQRSENVLTSGNWSIGMNAHGLSGSSLPRDQPSGYLHSLQMMSNKGDNQLYDVAQKFNNIEGFQDQRGGIQQREYNFLNAQTKPYAQEPNVMAYPQQMQQSYDPASWLGRQTPFPQVPARNPPTASCVWCSNMFYHESLNSFSQADTIVPTCPSCKAKMSEQLNLF